MQNQKKSQTTSCKNGGFVFLKKIGQGFEILFVSGFTKRTFKNTNYIDCKNITFVTLTSYCDVEFSILKSRKSPMHVKVIARVLDATHIKLHAKNPFISCFMFIKPKLPVIPAKIPAQTPEQSQAKLEDLAIRSPPKALNSKLSTSYLNL